MTSAGPQLDPDRMLALSYVLAERRPALSALWHLDAALGAVLASGREPMVSRIKLAWWRDALDKLDTHAPPAEPVLRSAAQMLPLGVGGSDLAAMEEGWALLLDSGPLGASDLDSYAAGRGGLLFRYSAILLGEPAFPRLEQAGQAWALVDLARRSGSEADCAAALAAARPRLTPARWPSRLRPLGMLAALAARDAAQGSARWEPQGAPGRMLRMLRHRVTGF